MIILSPLVKPKIKEQAAVHNTEANTVSKVRQIPIGKVMTMMNGTINDAIVGIDQRLPYDFIEVDFKNIWDYLGYINGDTVREDLLDTIFANFCIGK